MDLIQWAALLRSCSAFEAFRKNRHGRITGSRVVEYLVLDAFFPKSVYFSVSTAESALRDISGDSEHRFSNPAVRALGKLRADDDAREQMRLQMVELYRTALGHFRHESGHYYWDFLVRDHPAIGRFRARFGDERANYAASLQRYYENGAPSDWQAQCITPYATSHP